MIDNPTQPETEPSRQSSRLPWGISDAMFGFVLVAAGSLVALVLLSILRNDSANEPGPITIVAMSSLQVLMLAAVWLLAIKRRGASWSILGIRRAGLRWPIIGAWAALGLVLSLVAGAVYSGIVTVLGIESLEPPPVPESVLGEGPIRLLTVGILIALGPFAEEVFFRGFLLMSFVQGIGVVPGVIIASGIFAISHPNIAVILPVFASGVILSWLYLKTRSIWPPFLAHMGQNYLAVTFAS